VHDLDLLGSWHDIIVHARDHLNLIPRCHFLYITESVSTAVFEIADGHDRSINHMPFPIGDMLEPSLYLQLLSRYSASKTYCAYWHNDDVTSSRTWPFDTSAPIGAPCNRVYISSRLWVNGPRKAYVIGVTTKVTFQGHMSSSITWPFDIRHSPHAISNWLSIGTEPLSPTVFQIFCAHTFSERHWDTPMQSDCPTQVPYRHAISRPLLHWIDNNKVLTEFPGK